jgi:hypothetical protein
MIEIESHDLHFKVEPVTEGMNSNQLYLVNLIHHVSVKNPRAATLTSITNHLIESLEKAADAYQKDYPQVAHHLRQQKSLCTQGSIEELIESVERDYPDILLRNAENGIPRYTVKNMDQVKLSFHAPQVVFPEVEYFKTKPFSKKQKVTGNPRPAVSLTIFESSSRPETDHYTISSNLGGNFSCSFPKTEFNHVIEEMVNEVPAGISVGIIQGKDHLGSPAVLKVESVDNLSDRRVITMLLCTSGEKTPKSYLKEIYAEDAISLFKLQNSEKTNLLEAFNLYSIYFDQQR